LDISARLEGRLGQGLLIGLLLALVYGGGLGYPFQYDDLHSIAENSHIRSLAAIPAFFVEPQLFSADPRNAMYRPLVLVSYALNHALSGDEVWSYHLFNLGVHLGASLLVGAVARQLGSGRWALLAAMLFAMHPLASEPVNYISSRSESLCAFFVLLGFLAHLRSGAGWAAVSLASLVAGLLAKSVAIALAPLVLLYDLLYRRLQLRGRPLLLRHVGYWLISAAYLVGVREAIGAAVLSHPVRGLGVQALTQAKALVYYLKLMWLPQGLSVEHQFWVAGRLGEGEMLAVLLLLAGLGGLLWRAGDKEALFWGGWVLLTLAPSSLVPLNVLVNEHRLYLPLVAFAALVARLLRGVAEDRGRLGIGLAAALLAIYGLLGWQRTQVWRSPEALWADALRKGPQMPRSHIYVGDGQQRAGRYEEALRHYALARTVNPSALNGMDLLVSYNNQGAAYLALGRRTEAVDSYRRALAIDPTYERSRQALDALVALQELEWEPTAQLLHKKGLMLLIENRPAQAAEALEASLARQVRLETYRTLGMAYEQLGQVDEERRVYATLVALAPESPFGRAAAEKLRELEGSK